MPNIKKPRQTFELFALDINTNRQFKAIAIHTGRYIRIVTDNKLLSYRYDKITLQPYCRVRRHNRINIRLFRHEVELRGYLLKIEKQNAALKAIAQ